MDAITISEVQNRLSAERQKNAELYLAYREAMAAMEPYEKAKDAAGEAWHVSNRRVETLVAIEKELKQ